MSSTNSQVRLHAPLAHDEHAGTRDGLLAPEADDVHVLRAPENHALLVVKAIDHLEAAPHASGALEVQLRRGLSHLGLELGDELAPVTCEKALDLAHVRGVLLGRDAPGAHARTAPHVIVETGAAALRLCERHDVRLLGVSLELAAHTLPLRAGGDAQRHHLAHDVYGRAGGAGVRIGAEVARVRAMALTRVLDRGIDVALGERDVRDSSCRP